MQITVVNHCYSVLLKESDPSIGDGQSIQDAGQIESGTVEAGVECVGSGSSGNNNKLQGTNGESGRKRERSESNVIDASKNRKTTPDD